MTLPPEAELAPPARLAIVYATARYRAAFKLILQIDQRMADIVAKAREPLVGQIKMAWWREGFTSPPESRPKGEPLFEALAGQGNDIPPASLEALVSAWELLLGQEDWWPDLLTKHADLRAQAVFGTYGDWLCAPDDMSVIGNAWAVGALAEAFPGRVEPSLMPPRPTLPTARALRPLSILALSVYPVSGPRVIWHALTGR
jgi:phytoene synthase